LEVRIDLRALSVAYDREADVLYISFGPDREAYDAVLTDEDIIVRYKEGEVVGLTVLHFSERIKRRLNCWPKKKARPGSAKRKPGLWGP